MTGTHSGRRRRGRPTREFGCRGPRRDSGVRLRSRARCSERSRSRRRLAARPIARNRRRTSSRFRREVLPIAVAAVERVVFVHHPNVVTDEQEFDRLDRFPVFELALVCLECRLRGLLGIPPPNQACSTDSPVTAGATNSGSSRSSEGSDTSSPTERVVNSSSPETGSTRASAPASRGRFRVR